MCAVNVEVGVDPERDGDQRSNAVREMEEGAEFSAPWPSGTSSAREGLKPLQGASVKSRGLERCSKRRGYPRQVSTTKMSESEPSDDASKACTTTSKPGCDRLLRDEPGGWSRSWSGGVRCRGGMSVVRALVRNSGTSRVVVPLIMGEREYAEAEKLKVRVPDAAHWGGLRRSSDEGAVMALERRPRTSKGDLGQPGDGDEPSGSDRGSKPDDGRLSRPV